MINPNVARFLDIDPLSVDHHVASSLLFSLGRNLCLSAGFVQNESGLWTGPEPIKGAVSINGYHLDFTPNEYWGCMYMSETTRKCDPVLPLDPDEWKNLVRSARLPHSEEYGNSLGTAFRSILTPKDGEILEHLVSIPVPRTLELDVVQEGFASAQALSRAVLAHYNVL